VGCVCVQGRMEEKKTRNKKKGKANEGSLVHGLNLLYFSYFFSRHIPGTTPVSFVFVFGLIILIHTRAASTCLFSLLPGYCYCCCCCCCCCCGFRSFGFSVCLFVCLTHAHFSLFTSPLSPSSRVRFNSCFCFAQSVTHTHHMNTIRHVPLLPPSFPPSLPP